MSAGRAEDRPERPALPAGTVYLWVCVRCGREIGLGPGKVPPGARIGGSKFSGITERYCCGECLRKPCQYWT